MSAERMLAIFVSLAVLLWALQSDNTRYETCHLKTEPSEIWRNTAVTTKFTVTAVSQAHKSPWALSSDKQTPLQSR